MGVQMDKTSIIVCSVIGVVGLLSAIFGFSAEGTKLNPYSIVLTDDLECLYPPNPAAGLGICASIFLLLSQVTISVAGGCCGCCKSRAIPSETKRMVGVICAVFSWIAALIAMGLLIDGASLNTPGLRATSVCVWLKDGVFAGAGLLALAATGLGIASFIMLRPSQQQQQQAVATAPDTSATATPNNMPFGQQSPSPGVVIGQPLLPLPPSNKPQPPSDDYLAVKPQAYQYQQQQPHQIQAAVAPTHHQSSHPQGYYVQNLQAPPPPPPAAAQPQHNNVSHAHAPYHQQHPAAAPAVAVAAAAAMGMGMGQGQQPLPQQVPLHQVPLGGAGVPVPGARPATALPTAGSGMGLQTVIGHEVARQGVKMAAQVMTHALFSSHNDDTVADYVPDSDGGAGGDAVEVAN